MDPDPGGPKTCGSGSATLPGGVLVQRLVGVHAHVAERAGIAGGLHVTLLHVVHDVLLHAGRVAAGPALPHLPSLANIKLFSQRE